jgi:hypothetical protein
MKLSDAPCVCRAPFFYLFPGKKGGVRSARPALFLGIAACLLPFLLAGCSRRSHQPQTQPMAPPIEDTPPPNPEPSPSNLPPPVITVPNQTLAAESGAKTALPPAPKPPVRHKKKPIANTPQQASNGSSGVSAIGLLSSGAPSDQRGQTAALITATEHGLSAITRPLNEQERKTAAHIREFLKQAREALSSGDVDGARTLAAKAKVLLGELSR